MSAKLDIRRDDALGPDALGLIGKSEVELASIYPPEVRYAFSPQELLDAGVVFVVGYQDQEPVACGGIALLDGYAELKRVFVDETVRGQGLAGQIVGSLEDLARDQQRAMMRLETGEASPDAIRAYQKLGYHRRGPFGAYEENGSSVFMEKAL
ncbi:MAG: GNAT family N-acetyltransferase [Pseudomonadota bacterium]